MTMSHSDSKVYEYACHEGNYAMTGILSAARADASRRILQSAGVDPDRVYQVSGKATSEPLYPDDPMLPGNRRIAIVLLREAPVLPPSPAL